MRKLLATILLLLCGVLLLSNCNLADNVGDKLNGVPSGYTKAEEPITRGNLKEQMQTN